MNEFEVGQRVKLSPFYISNYPNWKVADKIGKVVSYSEEKIPFASLTSSKEDLARFVGRYGKLDTYPICTIMITFPELSDVHYMVSQFGIEKVEDEKPAEEPEVVKVEIEEVKTEESIKEDKAISVAIESPTEAPPIEEITT